jgi:hypothetical protein
MRRHISGLSEFRYVSFTSEIEWWWASGPQPNTVWAVASIAYVVLLVLVLQQFPRWRADATAHPDSPADAAGRAVR